MGTVGVSPGFPRPESREFWCPRMTGGRCLSFRREREKYFHCFFVCFYPDHQVTGWCPPTMKGNLSHLVHRLTSQSLLETPSQIHLEVMLYQFSSYFLIQPNRHLIFTFTILSVIVIKLILLYLYHISFCSFNIFNSYEIYCIARSQEPYLSFKKAPIMV